MSKLMLATPEAGSCTRKEAFAMNLIPSATNSYQPFSNEEMILMINKVAKMYGMELTNEELGMDLKGMRFFGVYTVEGFDFFGGRIKLTVGFCNSYNKSMSGRVCIGGDVMVCSNRCFYAYTDEETGVNGMALAEHRPGIHDGLFKKVEASFAGIEAFRKKQELFYGHLDERSMTQEDAYHLIVKAAQAGVVNKTRILRVAEEWDWQDRGPENDEEEKSRIWHPEFKPRTAYSLFNAFTEVQKDRMKANPVSTNIQTMGLTEFFYAEYNRA
jgi:hypothetical protein